MDLLNYELLPGVISSVKDDEHLGRLKVTLPGYETPENMKVEAMPWVYPLSMTGTYQGFTKMTEGAKVWVLVNKKNNYERWYWPMFELNENTKKIVSGYDNTEVLVSRDVGGNNVYIYYTDSNGIVLSIGESKINICPNGNIYLTDSNGGYINVKDGSIYLNTEGQEVVPKGNTLQAVLQDFAGKIEKIGSEMTSNAFVSSHGEALMNAASKFKEDLNDILSKNVYIPK